MSTASRLNVQFNERQKKTLDEMSVELGTTRTGVLKTALSLLEIALTEQKRGNRLGVVKDDEVLKEIVGI